MEKLILIDGNSLLNRGFYATPLLTDKEGNPTNAVYAFVNILIKLFHEQKPDYMCVAFDLKAPTFRHKMYSEYKGTRKPAPEDLIKQFPLLKKVLDTIGIARIEKEGLEADDLIGILSKKTNFDTIIITGDRDALQLVDEYTKVYFTKRGVSDIEIYDLNNFKELTGLSCPKKLIDYKALRGDTADNIPGVQGIGEKTALQILEQYEDIESLYSGDLSTFTKSVQGKLESGKDMAFLSKKLATIETEADIEYSLEKMICPKLLSSETWELFSLLGFRSIVKRTELFEKIENKKEYIVEEITTLEDLKSSVVDIKNFTFCYDEKYVYIANGEKVYNVLLKLDFFSDGINFGDCILLLKKVFENEDVSKLLFNKKSLLKVLDEFGVKIKGKVDDVMIEKYLVDFIGKSEILSDVIKEKGYENPAVALLTLDKEYKVLLKEMQLESVYYDIEMPLIDVLYDMEVNGVKVDTKKLEELSVFYENVLNEVTEKIYSLAGEKFNIKSPQQLASILFDKLNLDSGKKNKRGYSTSIDVLESLYDKHEIIQHIIEYRKIGKLKSTYIDGIRPLIDRKTCLVHTDFDQTMTSTGRLSSKEPNLQNIPVKTEEGLKLRKLFIAREEENVLVSADYSQIELRLLTHFSACPELVDAYNRGEDIHASTASKVFKVPMEEVTKSMRSNAKAVNFGIIYGISEYGLAQNIKCSVWEAKELIKNYFETYGKVKEYLEGSVELAKEKGYAETLFGRKRIIPELKSSNRMTIAFGERVAKNMPLQGTSADIIKIAMINVKKRFDEEKLKAKLILQVHDELIIDCPKTELEKVEKILKSEMENAANLIIPLAVDVNSGYSWFDAK